MLEQLQVMSAKSDGQDGMMSLIRRSVYHFDLVMGKVVGSNGSRIACDVRIHCQHRLLSFADRFLCSQHHRQQQRLDSCDSRSRNQFRHRCWSRPEVVLRIAASACCQLSSGLMFGRRTASSPFLAAHPRLIS